MASIPLLTNATANGSGPERNVSGGTWMLFLDGVFDGATVDIEHAAHESSDWLARADGTFSAPARTNFTLAASKLRATVSVAGASTNITARFELVDALFSPVDRGLASPI